MKVELKSNRFPNTNYFIIGDGTPIVLLDGFCEDHRIWEFQIEELSKQYKLILPDFPGSGLSELPQVEMSMELLADFVKEILDQENIMLTIMLGHSMGGYVTLAFVEKYNQYLKAFSLIHSSSFEDTDEKKQTRQKGIKLIEQGGAVQFVKTMIPNLYSSSSQKNLTSIIETHLTNALEISSKTLIAYYSAMMKRLDRKFVLTNTKIPVLFIVGKEDIAVPYSVSLAQMSLPSFSKLLVLDECGHMGMRERINEVNQAIISFCDHVFTLKMT